jgi:hypothetical protein
MNMRLYGTTPLFSDEKREDKKIISTKEYESE